MSSSRKSSGHAGVDQGRMMTFCNRDEAGEILADRLRFCAGLEPVVVALPSGGVLVASPIAQALTAPLDVLLVRKLPAPSNPKLPIGAVSEDGGLWINREVIAALDHAGYEISEMKILSMAREARLNLQKRGVLIRRGDAPLPLYDRTVILVSDGIATGAMMLGAIEALRMRRVKRIIVAAPIAVAQVTHEIRARVDELVLLDEEWDYFGVDQWYDENPSMSDWELARILTRVNHEVKQQKWDRAG